MPKEAPRLFIRFDNSKDLGVYNTRDQMVDLTSIDFSKNSLYIRLDLDKFNQEYKDTLKKTFLTHHYIRLSRKPESASGELERTDILIQDFGHGRKTVEGHTLPLPDGINGFHQISDHSEVSGNGIVTIGRPLNSTENYKQPVWDSSHSKIVGTETHRMVKKYDSTEIGEVVIMGSNCANPPDTVRDFNRFERILKLKCMGDLTETNVQVLLEKSSEDDATPSI